MTGSKNKNTAFNEVTKKIHFKKKEKSCEMTKQAAIKKRKKHNTDDKIRRKKKKGTDKKGQGPKQKKRWESKLPKGAY